ncbi:MAG TPA: hypothetical protein VHM16_05575, partial [Rubrobacteraceae bacterium]|nr:hypothetical protein [Rubrobacteraceae bacterium]
PSSWQISSGNKRIRDPPGGRENSHFPGRHESAEIQATDHEHAPIAPVQILQWCIVDIESHSQ